jgi:hypothetical protein
MALVVLAFIRFYPLENKVETRNMIDQMLEASEELGVKPRSDGRPNCVNRLTGLSDKKGKTRIVCIANIVLQSFFRPLHKHTFALLRNLKTDGTHDQEEQSDRVRKASESNKLLNSIDMSNCTDRFPALFQAVTLYLLGILTLAQVIV